MITGLRYVVSSPPSSSGGRKRPDSEDRRIPGAKYLIIASFLTDKLDRAGAGITFLLVFHLYSLSLAPYSTSCLRLGPIDTLSAHTV